MSEKGLASICAWTFYSKQFSLPTPTRNNFTPKYNKLFPLVCILFYDPINFKLSRFHDERTPSNWHINNAINRLPKDEQWNLLLQPIFKNQLLWAWYKWFCYQLEIAFHLQQSKVWWTINFTFFLLKNRNFSWCVVNMDQI